MTGDTMVFHPGTQHSRQFAKALDSLGRLAVLATSIHRQPGRFPYVLEKLPGALGASFRREFARFDDPELDPEKLKTIGWHEWGERLARRAGLPRLAEWLDTKGNETFGRTLRNFIAADDISLLWGFDNSSLEAFEMAGALGKRTVLDVTTPHMSAWKALEEKLADRHPDWVSGPRRIDDERAIDRLDRELELADRIVVGSPACGDSLERYGPDRVADKLRTVPYCWDAKLFGRTETRPVPLAGMPVRFLFVGQISARKGVPELLEAMADIAPEHARLTLLGGLAAPRDVLAPYEHRFTHIPHVPRSQVPAVMAEHDVLVMPSHLEGSSIALLEALASGLAIIQTKAAGLGATPDCGVVVERPRVQDLLEAMRKPIEDRDLLGSWQHAAMIEAKRYSFEAYCQNIGSLLADLAA